jgi:5-carboxymethyl-2-hydroxymuconate isomerase
MSRIHTWHWNISTGRHFQGIVAAILKIATGRNFSMSGINSGYHNLPTYEISLKSNSWICAVLWWPFWKWQPVEIFQCQVWIRDIIIYPHMKCRWNRTMLNLCSIVVAILKMATGRNFSMSGINSGHHNLPTYQILMISDNVGFFGVLWQPFWK